MFDLKKASSITIDYDSVSDLLAGTTNNPIAEHEIPELLREAVRTGKPVIITENGKARFKLSLDNENKFVFHAM